MTCLCYVDRVIFYPDINLNDLPAHHFVQSIQNITIEQGWLHLCLEWGDNMVLIFRHGIYEGIYNPNDIKQP
jgi:hypothetical protein